MPIREAFFAAVIIIAVRSSGIAAGTKVGAYFAGAIGDIANGLGGGAVGIGFAFTALVIDTEGFTGGSAVCVGYAFFATTGRDPAVGLSGVCTFGINGALDTDIEGW